MQTVIHFTDKAGGPNQNIGKEVEARCGKKFLYTNIGNSIVIESPALCVHCVQAYSLLHGGNATDWHLALIENEQ